MKSIPNNPASTCSPFARNGGIQPSAAAERQNAAQTPPSEAVPVGLRSSGRPKAGRTSITKRVKTALATALLTGLTTVLYAAPPTITARVEPDSIGIGDRFDVVIDVDRDLVQVVEFPTFNPPPQSGLEVVESHPVDTLRRDGRHLSLRKRYTLAAFEEGNLGLGRAQVLYLDKNITDTLYTADTLRLQVGTFQIDSTSHTIYDIKAQRTLPLPLRRNQRLRPLEPAGFDRPGRRDLRRPPPDGPLRPQGTRHLPSRTAPAAPHRGHPSARNAPQPETLAERTPQTVLLGPDGHPAHLSGRTIRLRRDGDDL